MDSEVSLIAELKLWSAVERVLMVTLHLLRSRLRSRPMWMRRQIFASHSRSAA